MLVRSKLISSLVSIALLAGCAGEGTIDDHDELDGDEQALSGTVGVGTVLVVTVATQMRSVPRKNGTVVTNLSAGNEVTTVEAAPQKGFYKVKYLTFTGWVTGKALQIKPPPPAPEPTPTPSPSSVVLSASSVAAGGTFTAVVNGGSGDPTQWVALYVASALDTAWSYNGNWKYLNGTQVAPTAAIPTPVTLTFTAPNEAGTYNLRFFANTGISTRLAVSANVTVTAPAPTPTPSPGQAVLSWTAPTTNSDGSSLTDLAGYRVYYGTSSRAYTSNVNVGKVTSFTLTPLASSTYFFSVTAYDTNGNESVFSNEASKTIQ